MKRRTCDELGICQGHSTPCSGCSSHAKACPCPQACGLPSADDATPTPTTDRTARIAFGLAWVFTLGVLAFAIKAYAAH